MGSTAWRERGWWHHLKDVGITDLIVGTADLYVGITDLETARLGCGCPTSARQKRREKGSSEESHDEPATQLWKLTAARNRRSES